VTGLPETHLDGLVLTVLERGSAHGRQVARAIPAASAAATHRSLRRLEREGLVVAVPERRRLLGRRAYRLTRRGATALAVRRLEWRSAAVA
jgi:DNA-binding PadR family transcriptional regulator